MTDETLAVSVVPSPPGGVGSAAGQAYREQLVREKATGAATAETDPGAATDIGRPAPFNRGSDARAAERKKVSGRARIVVMVGGADVSGKLIDMSSTGACILMDDMLPVKKVCTLECDIFQNGTRHVFSVQAVLVYGVLARGHGFKVGFQFGPRSPAALKTIAAILN